MPIFMELSRGLGQYMRQSHGQNAPGSQSVLEPLLQAPHFKTWAYLTKDQVI